MVYFWKSWPKIFGFKYRCADSKNIEYLWSGTKILEKFALEFCFLILRITWPVGDSRNSVGIFEKMRPKLTSGSQNLKENVFK